MINRSRKSPFMNILSSSSQHCRTTPEQGCMKTFPGDHRRQKIQDNITVLFLCSKALNYQASFKKPNFPCKKVVEILEKKFFKYSHFLQHHLPTQIKYPGKLSSLFRMISGSLDTVSNRISLRMSSFHMSL